MSNNPATYEVISKQYLRPILGISEEQVPLSTQVYKWVPANLLLWGNPAMD